MPRIAVWVDWMKVAEANGIDENLFKDRIWNRKPPWTYERAATEPKKKPGRPKNTGRITEEDYRIAKERLDLSRHGLNVRIYKLNMTMEEALMKPKRR